MDAVLGIDFGEKRVGCALADAETRIPLPYATIQVKNETQVLDEILRIVEKEHVDTVVVGLPLNREGQDTQKTKEVRAFVTALKARIAIPVETIDERYTSRMSTEGIASRDRARGMIDERAAQMILERYLAHAKKNI